VMLLFGAAGLFLWCPGRVLNARHISAGSSDGSSGAEALSKATAGDTVASIQIEGALHDLRVRFKSGQTLEVFPNSSKSESWQASAGPDNMVVAGPTHLWSDF
jgi:hypothetical protein